MGQDLNIGVAADTSKATASLTSLGNTVDALAVRSVRAMELDAKSRERQVAAINKQTKAQEESNRIAAAAAGLLPKAASEAEVAIGKATKATHEFSMSNAGTMREMLVMFHEGISGNFKRMAGSAVVMGERMNAMKYIFSGTGVAVGAAAAAIGALAIAAEEGYKRDEDFRKSMILTGGAAGVTGGQFRALAQTIASETGRGVASAQEALQALVASGQVAPQNLAKMGTAIVQVAHLTGESASVVAKQFDDMAGDVVGWINRHKEYANSLTAAQVESIRQLQKTDDIQGAVGATLDAINKKTQDSAGFWSKLGTAASNAWASMSRGMSGTNTPEDKLAEMQQRLQEMEHSGNRGGAPDWTASVGRGRTLGNQRDDLTAGIAAQQAQVTAAQQQAALKGTQQATENAAKAADQHLHTLLDEARGAAGMTEALRVLRAEFASHDAARKQDGATTPDWLTPDAREEMLAKARKTHTSGDDRKDDNAYNSTLKQLTDEKAKLDALTKSYADNTHAVTQRAAVLQTRFADPADPLSKIGTKRQGEVMAAGVATDKSDEANKNAESVEKITAQVKAYEELTNAKEMDAKAAFIAQALAAHDLDIAKQGTDQAKQALAVELATSAAKRYDEERTKAAGADAAKRQESVKSEIDTINRENDALHESTLARLLAADAAKLQKSAEEALLKPAADQVAIQATLARNLQAVAEARRAQYADSRSATTGASNAGTKWSEDASNQGAVAAKMTTSTLDGISNAIDKLRTTGKFAFKDLWKSMADEFLSAETRMFVAKMAGSTSGIWGSLAGAIGGMFSPSSGGSPEADSGSVNMFAGLDGARATGGNVNAGGAYMVGERGTEVFKPSGSGTIVPNDALGGSGDTTIHIGQGQVVNVGQGVSRAEVASALAQSNKQTLSQVQRLSSTGKLRQ